MSTSKGNGAYLSMESSHQRLLLMPVAYIHLNYSRVDSVAYANSPLIMTSASNSTKHKKNKCM